jgi:hypothetical protein
VELEGQPNHRPAPERTGPFGGYCSLVSGAK